MLMSKVTIESEYQLAYITLGLGDFGKTLCVSKSSNVDIDHAGEVIGVEFISLEPCDVTIEELVRITDIPEKIFHAIELAKQRI